MSLYARLLLGLTVTALGLVIVALVLYLTDSAFDVWEHLKSAPTWFGYVYAVLLLLLLALPGWLLWRALRPRRSVATEDPGPASEDEIRRRLSEAREQAIDVEAAERELEELARRRQAGTVYVALFGDISSGKSSLIGALVPDAQVTTSPRGGTTREVAHHESRTVGGDRLVLADLPGLNEAEGSLDETARQEALRAHVAVYVCEGDLTRSQYAELKRLLELGKPTIIAVNKVDRYSEQALAAVQARLRERLAGYSGVQVVPVQAGGTQEIARVLPDGREEVVERPLSVDVEALKRAVQQVVDRDPASLDRLRDATVFSLAERKLDEAEAAHRRARAEALVSQYSRRAVVGAMAAVAPGTDLLIQGYLGYALIRELSQLYGVPAREVDIHRLLQLAQGHVGKALPLLLAVAGNALKAFPGMGTLTGGLLHAVAYGLIFDTLGRAVARTLQERGDLAPVPAVSRFKEGLGEDLEGRARRFLRLALEAKGEAGSGDSRGRR